MSRHVRIMQKLEERKAVHKQMHWIWRVLFVTGGFFVLAAGLAMLVLPGPAVIVIPIGLAVLSLEFLWAEKLLDRVLSSGVSLGSYAKKVLVQKRLFLAAGALLFLLALLSAIYLGWRLFV